MRLAAMLGAACLGAAGATAVPAGTVTALPPQVPSQCAASERVLYSCAFPRGTGSLCAGKTSVHYRFGPRGHPDIDLASRPDWSNVHTGFVRGQGSGHQSHVRLTTGRFHYVIFEGADGYLTEDPGRTYSGIAVLKGPQGEQELATLACPGRAVIALDDAWLSRHAAGEKDGGPFDIWY
ncbi:hypothetical protein [Novosphingobium beihaiensis]|uniref:Secreted protein n=1 Tax=Novosphingobium beihaiensis TaxID=2930389 RepID=A0ABT0BPR4_9SPHN|nr:hypothetical protein [Novosphingobium beihaiensis]MCJ2187045.1 hypothetical protein [Novosphingobium beihaiensis]